MRPVIQVEHLSKHYRLGLIGGGTLREDLHRWWAKARGRPDPLLKIGQEDHGNREGGELWALRDVSFQVQEGEILGIIGRNGAGKSTLLKILSRITAPTTGQVKIRGRVGSLLEVGTGFHPELTGRENIYLNGAILGMKKTEIDRKLDEIIDFAEIEPFIDTPVKRYSSGMYVRLAFAVAAHLEPEILIVDEVLAVGDAQFQKKCLGKMQDVSHSGRTVLFVSHNLIAVQGLCNKGILLKDGAIELDDEVNSLLSYYRYHIYSLLNSSLAERKDRVGNGQLKFIGYCFRDQDGSVVRCAVVGQEIFLHIYFESKTPLQDVNIAFNLYEDEGYVLMNCNTEDPGQTFLNLKTSGEGEVVCKIDSLPLRAGIYVGNLFCTVKGTIADWIKAAIQLTIADEDVYKTGKLIGQGKLLVSYSWELKK